MRKVTDKDRYLLSQAWQQANPDDGSLMWPVKVFNLQCLLSMCQTLDHLPDLGDFHGNKVDDKVLAHILGPITLKRLHKLWKGN